MDAQELGLTAVRAVVIYGVLLAVVRLSGKRTIGGFSAFDLIVALILGEVSDEPIFGDVPMLQAIVAIVAVAGIHYLNGYLSYRSRAIDRLTSGSPIMLVENGEVDTRALARELMSEEELQSLLRQQEVEQVTEVKRAMLEPDGQLSVFKTSPSDPSATAAKRHRTGAV